MHLKLLQWRWVYHEWSKNTHYNWWHEDWYTQLVDAIEAPKLIRILWPLYEYQEALSFCTKHHQTTPVVVLKSFSNTASFQIFENNIENLVVILRTQISSTLQTMPSEILAIVISSNQHFFSVASFHNSTTQQSPISQSWTNRSEMLLQIHHTHWQWLW